MTPQERDVLLPLLDRLRQTRVADKDAEADQLIRQAVQAQPDAPYVLAQTVLMQDYALHAAQDRLRALEQQLRDQQQANSQRTSGGAGGFLGALLGGHSAAPQASPPPGYAPAAPSGGAQGAPPYPASGAGYGQQIANAVQPGFAQPSFLRSAAQTAAGVAGGALLVQGLEGLFGGHGGFGGRGFFDGGGGLPGYAPNPDRVENVTNNYYDESPRDDVAGAYPGSQDADLASPSDGSDGGQTDYGDVGNDLSSNDLGTDDLGGNDLGDDSYNV